MPFRTQRKFKAINSGIEATRFYYNLSLFAQQLHLVFCSILLHIIGNILLTVFCSNLLYYFAMQIRLKIGYLNKILYFAPYY